MNKPILLVGLLVGGLGCFGSDPNMNSQYLDGSANPTTGSGGSGTGTGGAAGNVIGPIVGTPIATFASGAEGFQLNTYHDTGSTNLADPASGANPAPTLSFDSGDGSPDPGSLKVTATYSGSKQYVDVQKNMMMTPADWQGRTMHVRVRIASGSFTGGAQVYVLTDPFIFGGTHTNITNNHNWQEFRVNLVSPVSMDSGYDPSKVTVLGVQLTSGDMGSSGAVTFNVDSFFVEPALPGGGGAGAGGATGNGGTGGATGTGGITGTGASNDASLGN